MVLALPHRAQLAAQRISLAVVLASALALSGCGKGQTSTIDVTVVGEASGLVQNGLRLSPAGQLVRSATAEGLVGFDAQGRVIPLLADRWIVTDDGLSFIFRLREGLWPDGTALTGEAARDALLFALANLRGTSLGADLSAIEDVRAMTGRVVEVRLAHPMPDLLDLLAQPELALLRKDKGSGAMTMKRAGRSVLLQPVNPEKRGLQRDPGWADDMHTIRLSAMPADKAIKRFQDGEVSAVLGGTIADFASARSAGGLSGSALRVDPVAGLFGLVVANGGAGGPLATPELREAIAMAIDRDALASALGIREFATTSRVVPGGAGDAPASIGERWANMDMAKRRATAEARLAAIKGKGGQPTALRIALPIGTGADLIFAQLSADFAAVGLKAVRVGQDAPADLRLLDSAARYGRADWYLAQFACSIGRRPCSEMADAKAAAAQAQSDPVKRVALLEDAEAALTLANTYIPLGYPVRWSLVSGDLPGFALNARGWHPLTPIALPPK